MRRISRVLRDLETTISRPVPPFCEWPAHICRDAPTQRPAENVLYLCDAHVVQIQTTCPESEWGRTFHPITGRSGGASS
jgi:hypothetical protein